MYSSWPTFPQAFINQKFVGGIDVITELIENEEFDDMVPQKCKPLPPKERFELTLKENKCVILINGTLQQPSDENSKALIEDLKKEEVKFIGVDFNTLP